MTQWNVVSTFVLDQIYGYQSANKLRENAIVLASRRAGRFLGGSRFTPLDPASSPYGLLRSKPYGLGPNDVVNFVDVEIDGTNQTGITYQARLEVRTEHATMTVTPKIRNVTDATDAGVGSACAAGAGDYTGTSQKQTVALTIATGIKKYRLQYTYGGIVVGANAYLTGEIESFATA